MDATNSRPSNAPAPAWTEMQRALVVSSIFSESDAAKQIGQQNYSYYFVYRAFAPLLERWASTFAITQPESRLDYALWRARQQNLEPLHLSFLPLHLTVGNCKSDQGVTGGTDAPIDAR